jgi:hypothetical protein
MVVTSLAKKTDVVEHLWVLHPVGFLTNKPPGMARVLFV